MTEKSLEIRLEIPDLGGAKVYSAKMKGGGKGFLLDMNPREAFSQYLDILPKPGGLSFKTALEGRGGELEFTRKVTGLESVSANNRDTLKARNPNQTIGISTRHHDDRMLSVESIKQGAGGGGNPGMLRVMSEIGQSAVIVQKNKERF